jgi:hypothetical protein
MRKNFFLSTLAAITLTGLILTGCSKDDTTPPVITLNGSASVEVSLNSGAWTDPGATAEDDEDGTLTVSSDASSTNPNTNLVGTYTITYTAQDAAGNVEIATRTVRVKNDAEDFEGTYSVHDTVPGFVFNYSQTITADNSVNNKIHFNRFADYANNTAIFANKLGNGSLEIPLQTAVDIGSGTGTCDIATHQFSSSAFTSTSNGFILSYTDAITAPGACIGSTTGVATYTKQ